MNRCSISQRSRESRSPTQGERRKVKGESDPSLEPNPLFLIYPIPQLLFLIAFHLSPFALSPPFSPLIGVSLKAEVEGNTRAQEWSRRERKGQPGAQRLGLSPDYS